MAALFPYVGEESDHSKLPTVSYRTHELRVRWRTDQCRRLENLLKRSLHPRTCGAAIQEAHGVWQTSLNAQQYALGNCHHLLKCVVIAVIHALGKNSANAHELFKLRVYVGFLRDIASVNSCIKKDMQQLGAIDAVATAQLCFSSYTSGWNLCEELEILLSSHSKLALEQRYDLMVTHTGSWVFQGAMTRSRSSIDGEETCSLASAYTAVTAPTSIVSFKNKPYQNLQPILEEIRNTCRNPELLLPGNKFRLQTLEEHRFATRFQPKRVTVKTWRKAQREATQLLRSGDRISLSEALYLLLEIVWLGPVGAPLARNYANIGSVYMTFDHLEEAAKAYRHCLHINPSHWKARYNLGVALARLEDHVDASKQLQTVTSPGYCPVPEIVDQTRLMLHEIEESQLTRNRAAFKQATKARVFTAQFLQTLHIVTATDIPIIRMAPLTQKLRPLPPVLLARPEGWKGAMASLVHRLHVFACCRGYSVDEVASTIDPEKIGISIKTFDTLVKEITGAGLHLDEKRELCSIFEDRSICVHFLTPRPETLSIMKDLQRVGGFRSALDWRLTVRRTKWSQNVLGNPDSFRFWLELPMNRWAHQVLSQATGTAAVSTTLEDFINGLKELGWLSPFDFGLDSRPLLQPNELTKLSFSDRGTLIFESHRARSSIQYQASVLIQMQARRYLINRRVHNRKRHAASWRKHEKLPARQTLLPPTTENDIVHSVASVVSDLVDAIVRRGVADLQDFEAMLVASSDAPVRTELRLRRLG